MMIKLTSETLKPRSLSAYDTVCDGLLVSFDAARAITCDLRTELGTNAFGTPQEYAVISGSSRKKDAWLGLEFTLGPHAVDFMARLRTYPANTLSPVIYADHADGTDTIKLDIHPSTDAFFAYHMRAKDWADQLNRNTYTGFRLGLMTNTGAWFAIGVMDFTIGEPNAQG